jgi:serine/threonine protein phosphatase PrpC
MFFSKAGSQKKENQDHCVLEKVNDSRIAIVCDGHGNITISKITCEYMMSLLKQSKWQTIEELVELIQTIFPKTQEYITTYMKQQAFVDKRGVPMTENGDTLTGGTTCTLVVLFHGQVLCAHVGDSPCYLFRSNGSVELMIGNHTPENLDEMTTDLKERGIRFVYNIHGEFDKYRKCPEVHTLQPPENVAKKPDGTLSTYMTSIEPYPFALSVTRSFGNLHVAKMNRTPTITVLEVLQGDKVVVGSDGIFDIIVESQNAYPFLPTIKLDTFGQMLNSTEYVDVFEDCVSRAKKIYGTSTDDMTLCVLDV